MAMPWFDAEDLRQEMVLLQLEKGDTVVNQRLLWMEALDRLDPRHYRGRKRQRESRMLVRRPNWHRRFAEQPRQYLLHLACRLSRLDGAPQLRTVLLLTLCDGLSSRAIARRLHLDRETVGRYLHRAIAHLS
jgi:DNA-directed RNA polymerase specialized sigma24 family protein